MEARPIVTAGFKCAPLKLPTAYTATVTPNAQPAVMTIHPAFWPLVLLSTTLATTPSPRMISSMVPSSSARKGVIGLNWEGAKLSAGGRLVYMVGVHFGGRSRLVPCLPTYRTDWAAMPSERAHAPSMAPH